MPQDPRAVQWTGTGLALVDAIQRLVGDAVLAEAAAVQREDAEANHAMGAYGANWLLAKVGKDRPLRILTHRNTGAPATAGWGTALGVIRGVRPTPRRPPEPAGSDQRRVSSNSSSHSTTSVW